MVHYLSLHNLALVAVLLVIFWGIQDLIALVRKPKVRAIKVPILTIHLHSKDDKTLFEVADRMSAMFREHIETDVLNGSVKTDEYEAEDGENPDPL